VETHGLKLAFTAMMTPSSDRTDQGFSLIEVLIAGGILAGAAVALSGLCVISADALLAARQRSIAAILASTRLEELLADTDALRGGIDAADRVSASGGSEPDYNGWYQRQWSVTASPALPDKLVVVSVLVTSPAGARLHLHDVRLVTVAARRQ
jgi:Tfp pilus assembly protein PilV